MRGDVIEVSVAIGDTIVTTGLAHGPFAFDWAPAHILVPPAMRDAPVRTRVGIAEVTMMRVAAPERSLPYTSDFDKRAWRYLVLSLTLHLLMWGVATTQAPAETRPIEVCGAEPPTYVAMFAAEAAPRDLELTAETVEPVLVPMFIDRPTRGKPPITALVPVAGSNRDVADVASPTGIAGATNRTEDILAALTAPSLAAGLGDATVYSGSEHTRGFGLDRTSFSGGGGCTEEPCGTIGALHYDPLRGGRGAGNGYGLVGRRTMGPTCTLTIPEAVSVGGLDKAIIQRRIRQRLDQLTYCYEVQLLANPNLAGEVALSFTIEPNGQVHGVVASGISDGVETCVAGVIGNIEFPRSDGTTQVHYPLRYHVAR